MTKTQGRLSALMAQLREKSMATNRVRVLSPAGTQMSRKRAQKQPSPRQLEFTAVTSGMLQNSRVGGCTHGNSRGCRLWGRDMADKGIGNKTFLRNMAGCTRMGWRTGSRWAWARVPQMPQPWRLAYPPRCPPRWHPQGQGDVLQSFSQHHHHHHHPGHPLTSNSS